MTTLDNPFRLDGYIYKITDYMASYSPDVVDKNPTAAFLLAGSMIGFITKAYITYNCMPANAQIFLIGPPKSGKSSLISAIKLTAPHFFIYGGTPEWVEQQLVYKRTDMGFPTIIIAFDEFGQILSHKQKRSYLSDLDILLKRLYGHESIESGRVTKTPRILPQYSYYANVLMALTYEDYEEGSSAITTAFIRRLLSLELREKIPRSKALRRVVDVGKLYTVTSILEDLYQYQANVIVHDNLVARIENALEDIESEGERVGLIDECIDACVDYFWKIMAWRAIDRALTKNQYEESEFFPLAKKWLEQSKIKFTPIDVYVYPEDIYIAADIVIEYIVPNYHFFSFLGDPAIAKVWRRMKRLLQRRKEVDIRYIAMYLKVKYSFLLEVLKTLSLAGLIEVIDENDNVVPLEGIEELSGKWRIRLAQERRKYIKPLALLKELRKKEKWAVDKFDEEQLKAIIVLLEEELAWLIEVKGKWYVTVHPHIVQAALGRGFSVWTGEEAIRRLGVR